MNTLPRAYPPIEQIPAWERREHMEQLRDVDVLNRANEILADPHEIHDALGDWGEEFGLLDLSCCLVNLYRASTEAERNARRAELNTVLRMIVRRYADKTTPPISKFLLPQAD